MRPVPQSVARVLDGVLASEPEREALATRSERLTYAELDRRADRAAWALRDLGVGPGDRVAASLPNDSAVVVAFHGAMRLGAVWVGINRALAPPEKRYLLADCGATLLLCDDDGPDLGVRVVAAGEWQAAVDAACDGPVGVDVDPLAPAGIAYTSGTTGHPKGAVHSQHNLLVPGTVLVETRGYGPDLRKGDCFPFTILNMAVLTTLLVSQAGGCSIVMDRIDAQGVAEWIRRERVTTWNGPPALLHDLALTDKVATSDLASLSEVWTGGADCPEAIRERFEARFGVPVTATYGLSEAPTVIAIDPRDGGHVPGASGRPLPHVEVRIVDGEVCVGPAPGDDRYRTMLGYWQRPEASASALAGGLLHTGDLGELGDDGYLRIRDRRSLLILRGGANVYPAEVERVLLEAPGVAACAVLGVPDERLGERVAAVVETTGGSFDEEAVRAHCLAALARYKVPERFVVVEAMPRNAMGKVVRARLPALLSTVGGRDVPVEADRARMRAERHAKLQDQLAAQGLDGLVLLGTSAVAYASGADAPACDSSRAALLRAAAVVVAGAEHPWLFTPWPEGAPPELPADHVRPAAVPDVEDGAAALAAALGDLFPAGARLGCDEVPHALARALNGRDYRLVPAAGVLGPAKLCKTPDELACIRRAQQVNEQAMLDVLPRLRPGVTQTDLSAVFLRRIFELGAEQNGIDPIWQVMPQSLADGPWTVHGDLAFPTPSAPQAFAEGDVVWVDSGVHVGGYASDFGRTWIVGDDPRPTPRQQDQFARWRAVVDAVLERCRPGVTAGELGRAAIAADAGPSGGRRPWIEHFYLAHGVGTDSAEMPMIGTDLGDDFDERLVMAPGMVLVLEPVIWDDGAAGYRSEDIVAITDDGWMPLSDHPYDPFGPA